MIIYNWLTEETAPILLNFIDNQFHMNNNVKSTYVSNDRMKLISFQKDYSIYRVIINEDGIKYSKELVELEGIEAFALQEIRNEKLIKLLDK